MHVNSTHAFEQKMSLHSLRLTAKNVLKVFLKKQIKHLSQLYIQLIRSRCSRSTQNAVIATRASSSRGTQQRRRKSKARDGTCLDEGLSVGCEWTQGSPFDWHGIHNDQSKGYCDVSQFTHHYECACRGVRGVACQMGRI